MVTRCVQKQWSKIVSILPEGCIKRITTSDGQECFCLHSFPLNFIVPNILDKIVDSGECFHWSLKTSIVCLCIFRFVIVPICLDIDCSTEAYQLSMASLQNSSVLVSYRLLFFFSLLLSPVISNRFLWGHTTNTVLSIEQNYHPLSVSSSKSLEIVDI